MVEPLFCRDGLDGTTGGYAPPAWQPVPAPLARPGTACHACPPRGPYRGPRGGGAGRSPGGPGGGGFSAREKKRGLPPPATASDPVPPRPSACPTTCCSS